MIRTVKANHKQHQRKINHYQPQEQRLVKVEEPATPRHSVPEPIHKTKLTRTELKQQRINNLVSQAV